jgi:phosphoribosylanthranilate isomerase
MTWVKICGMTNLEDALTAVDAGADAVGFVFYEKSPRRIGVETARDIVEQLPENVEKVGVFVGQSVEHVSKISEESALSAVQVYTTFGTEPALRDFVQNLQLRVFVAISGQRVTAEKGFGFSLSEELLSRVSAVFLDSGNSRQPGGTGTAFDWKSTAKTVTAMSRSIPVVIAGGLTPQNVGEAMEILKPWGVDVASGVEASPGKKDPEKVRAFVKAVRDADRKTS